MAAIVAGTGSATDILFSPEDKQWLRLSLLNQIKSLERMMAKYPAGSGAHSAHAADVAKIRKIMERFE